MDSKQDCHKADAKETQPKHNYYCMMVRPVKLLHDLCKSEQSYNTARLIYSTTVHQPSLMEI